MSIGSVFGTKVVVASDTCAICLEPLVTADFYITRCGPRAHHYFHLHTCLEEWVKHGTTCPTCKAPLDLQDIARDLEVEPDQAAAERAARAASAAERRQFDDAVLARHLAQQGRTPQQRAQLEREQGALLANRVPAAERDLVDNLARGVPGVVVTDVRFHAGFMGTYVTFQTRNIFGAARADVKVSLTSRRRPRSYSAESTDFLHGVSSMRCTTTWNFDAHTPATVSVGQNAARHPVWYNAHVGAQEDVLTRLVCHTFRVMPPMYPPPRRWVPLLSGWPRILNFGDVAP